MKTGTIKLKYLKGSKEKNAWMVNPEDRRMWNIVTPGHPRFGGTFSLKTLVNLGVVPTQTTQEAR